MSEPAWPLSAPIPWGAAKFLFVVMVQTADEDGICRLGVSRLALITSTDRRATQRQLTWLASKGWIVRQALESRRQTFAISMATARSLAA